METYLNLRVKREESCTNACAKCDRRHVVNTRMKVKKKGKVHPCTGTEALYRPYGP